MHVVRLSLLALGMCLLAAGCNPPPTSTSDDGSQGTPAAESHDHGEANGADRHAEAGHGHGAGPHDGMLADWGGGKFHVEFTVDHDKQEATVYVLGSDEKTAKPIATESIELSIIDPEMQITLTALPLETDPDGTASRFRGRHEKLGIVQEYAGTMTGVVDGTPFSGDFQEEPHADH